MEPDESLGEDARSIAYFDMCVSFPSVPLMGHQSIRCRILQREGERDLFELRHPAMASDDDADDDGYDNEMDSSDERQSGEGSATGRSESTGKCKKAPSI